MLEANIFKIFIFSTISNFQAIDFDNNGDFIYTINKRTNNGEFYDVFSYVSSNHTQNPVILKSLKGHGSQFQFRYPSIQTSPSYLHKNKHGYIFFKNWWGKSYGKALINGTSHKINFDIFGSDSKMKGTFQGMALSNTHALFTLSFFHPKTKKLKYNILYSYDLKSRSTHSVKLSNLRLSRYGTDDTRYKYHEFEGATFHEGNFYIGLKVQDKSKKTLTKVGVIIKLQPTEAPHKETTPK